jgi:hypothetical protein
VTARHALVLAAVALLALALVLRLRSHATEPGVVADPVRTPGVLNPEVTQATIDSTICVHGWTATIRPPVDYTNELKQRQMRAYGETGSPSGYQEDHLISLELGGHPTDPRNLWPERRPRADEVDTIENDLRARICSGAISLADGQRTISRIKHTRG